jgi:hypothetical protein
VTTLANTILALHLLGRDAEALALGSSDTAASTLVKGRTWMWLIDEDHKLTLSSLMDGRLYLKELMKHIQVYHSTVSLEWLDT